MAVPILEIPIDDKDFKAFVETFKKYQEELKAQPAAWDNVSSSIRDTVGVADDFASSLQKQIDAIEAVTRAEERRENKREDSARKKKKDQDDGDRHEEQQNTRRRQALDQVREYSRNVGSIAKQVGTHAIGAIGGGAAGLFGAAGSIMSGIPIVGGVLGATAMAGFEVMRNMNSARQNAHGLGVNVQTLQGWQNAMGPYLPAGSAEHLLSTVSQAQASPGGGGLFARFGIRNSGNRDVSDISAEMLTHAQKYLKSNPGQKGLWGAQALFGGALDTGTLRTLQTMSPKELKEQLEAVKKFAKEHADAEKTALELTQALSKAEVEATGIVDTFGKVVAKSADELTKAFKRLFEVIDKEAAAKDGGTPSLWEDPWGWATRKTQDAMLGGGLNMGGKNPRSGDFNSNFVDPLKKWWARTTGSDSAGYDAVVGHVASIPGGASTKTLGELEGYNKAIRARARAAGLGNSSALGQYQIVGGTRERVGKRLYGANWKNVKFDPQHQEEMAKHIWENDARYGNAHAVFASLPNSKKGAYAAYDWEHIRGFLAKGEGGLPKSDTGHAGKAVAEAVKKGVVAAHKSAQGGSGHVKIKVQQKPGSDVTVSGRQLAGN